MSPRLLGRRDVDAVKNACLELENAVPGLDGTITHIGGFKYVNNLRSSNAGVEPINFFSLRFNNKKLGISFSDSYGINYVKTMPLSEDDGTSSLSITGIKYYGFAGTGGYTDFGTYWNTQNISAGGATLTGLSDFIASLFMVYPTQYAQITDNTVLFTGRGIVPFYITYYDGYLFVYPIWVNFIQYITNKLETTSYIEIQPTTVPYGEENTLSASKVYLYNPGTYTGTHLTTGTRISNSNTHLYYVAVNDVNSTSVFSKFPKLSGRILRVTNTDATESAYLILGETSAYTNPSYNRFYKAIRLIGGTFDTGTTSHETSLWRLSQWGKDVSILSNSPFPMVVCQHKGRPFLANTTLQPDTIWASAINDKDVFNIGTYSQTVLKQDVSTDVSGLKYFNSSVLDRLAYELGLADGESEEIRWITSRRRMHLGTSNGEYQITTNAEFTYSKLEIIKLGSIKSKFIQPASGDRKVIYMDYAGYLRGISIEDKNYESEDVNLSVAYGKISPKYYDSITWSAEYNTVVVNDDTGKKSIIGAVDESTKTLAFSELTLPLGETIVDEGTGNDLYATSFKTYGDESGLIIVAENRDAIFDNFESFVNVKDYPYMFVKNYSGDPVSTYEQFHFISLFIGKEIEVILQSGESLFIIPELGFDVALLGYVNSECLEIRVPIKMRIKSFPIEDKYPFGDSVGVISRWDKATIQYIYSGKFYVGSEDGNLLPVEGLTDSDRVTGQVSIDFPNSPDRQNHIIIESVNPLTVSGVALRGVVYGED